MIRRTMQNHIELLMGLLAQQFGAPFLCTRLAQGGKSGLRCLLTNLFRRWAYVEGLAGVWMHKLEQPPAMFTSQRERV